MSVSSEVKIRVRYGETDQMGVVYHGNYTSYLEVARIDWLHKLGFSYRRMEEEGVMLPVVALKIEFKKSAKFDDVITIKTKLSNTPTARIEFDYTLYNDKGELLVLAKTTLAFIDKVKKRPIRCPIHLMSKINERRDFEKSLKIGAEPGAHCTIQMTSVFYLLRKALIFLKNSY